MSAPETSIVLAERGNQIFPQVESLVVSDQQSLEVMAAHMAVVKAWLKAVDEHHDPIIDSIRNSLDIARRKKMEMRAPGERALSYANGQSTNYVVETRRKNDEKARLERLENERKAQEQRDRELKRLEKAGASKAEVKAVSAAPLQVAPVTTAPAVEKPTGFVTQTRYSAEFEINEQQSVIAILKAFGVAAKTLKEKSWMLPMLAVNQVAANSHARAAREQFDVPGMKLVKTSSSHTRGAA